MMPKANRARAWVPPPLPSAAVHASHFIELGFIASLGNKTGSLDGDMVPFLCQ